MSSAAQRKSLTHGQTSVQLNHPTQQHPVLANRQRAREEYFGATTSIPTHIHLVWRNKITHRCVYFSATTSLPHVTTWHLIRSVHPDPSHVYTVWHNCITHIYTNSPATAARRSYNESRPLPTDHSYIHIRLAKLHPSSHIFLAWSTTVDYSHAYFVRSTHKAHILSLQDH
jgi:hypothetical protein